MYFKTCLKKPDDRNLILYARKKIPEGIEAPSPNLNPVRANPHLRWHPLLGEWVSYASHRQERTFLPPPEYNPLAPTRSREFPTELPVGDYDIAVFDNLFPSMASTAKLSDETLGIHLPTRPANGCCEVVVFSQDSKTSLGSLSLDHIELLIEVWADRVTEIGSREEIQYVMPFENRGLEMGVTLHHPHGQIYAYPFVPPTPARELENQKAYFLKNKRTLMGDLIADELKDGRRIIFHSDDVIAFVPACARYPYEVWIAPRSSVPTVAHLSSYQRRDLARALKTVTLKYDSLWDRPFPYLMIFKQAPTDGHPHPEAHFHIQFYPAYRSLNRLKYLAGTEIGAGMFANDSLPEAKAEELKKIEVSL